MPAGTFLGGALPMNADYSSLSSLFDTVWSQLSRRRGRPSQPGAPSDARHPGPRRAPSCARVVLARRRPGQRHAGIAHRRGQPEGRADRGRAARRACMSGCRNRGCNCVPARGRRSRPATPRPCFPPACPPQAQGRITAARCRAPRPGDTANTAKGDPARFACILCRLTDLDILHLGVEPGHYPAGAHIRASDGWQGQWIAP